MPINVRIFGDKWKVTDKISVALDDTNTLNDCMAQIASALSITEDELKAGYTLHQFKDKQVGDELDGSQTLLDLGFKAAPFLTLRKKLAAAAAASVAKKMAAAHGGKAPPPPDSPRPKTASPSKTAASPPPPPKPGNCCSTTAPTKEGRRTTTAATQEGSCFTSASPEEALSAPWF